MIWAVTYDFLNGDLLNINIYANILNIALMCNFITNDNSISEQNLS